jgi:ribosomal protein S18 acetylase RimI-like enzyme
MAETGFNVTDRFDADAMQSFMRQPGMYWPTQDALAPQPDEINFVERMLSPSVWTYAATLGGHICGYVQFVARTSVMSEITAGFHPQCRGRIAKAIAAHAIGLAFRDLGVVKIIACVPADNRPARMVVRLLGFDEEARLHDAIVRPMTDKFTTPLRDIIIYSLTRPRRSA